MTGGLERHNGLRGSTHPPPLPTPVWATLLGLGQRGSLGFLGEAVCRWARADGLLVPDEHRFEVTVFLELTVQEAETFICNWETFVL